jgi:hypothetical protein
MTVESGTGSGTRATVVEDAKPPTLDEIHYGDSFVEITAFGIPQETVPSAARQDAAQ